jgi:hypothetical protein
MAQHDYVIANGTGAAVRSDLNNALAAIVSQNSGATAPSTTYAYQWWADTTTGLLKLRNAANNAWITLFQLDGEWSTLAVENGSAAAPSIYFKDSGTDTGIYSPGADQFGIATGGTGRLVIDSSGNINIDSNTLYVDASNNRVGVGTSSPSYLLHANGSGTQYIGLTSSTNDAATLLGATSSGSFLINQSTTLPTQIWTNGNPRLNIDSSGRVGIATTTPLGLLDLGAADSATALAIAGWRAASYNGSVLQWGGITASQWSTAAFFTGGTERARIDSSGRLLVGTSTSRGNFNLYGNNYSSIVQVEGSSQEISLSLAKSGNPWLVLGNTSTASSGSGAGIIGFSASDGTNLVQAAQISCTIDGTPGSNDMPGRLVFSTTADGASSPTERMRITSAGFISIGGDTDTGFSNPSANNLAITTGGTERIRFTDDAYILFNGITNKALRDSTDSTGGNGLSIDSGAGGFLQIAAGGPTFFNRTGSDGSIIAFRRAGVPVGSISVTASATTYATSSDYRLKENVVALTGAIDRINDLRVCRFNFIADPDKTVDGFLAHEAQAIVPECVTGTKDEVDADGNPLYQGIDQSKLVPLLTAALQEALQKIEDLETRLSALESA